MKTIIWRLTPGGKVGQSKKEQLLKDGLEYVEKLKKENPNLEVKQTDTELTIEIPDDLR